MYIGEKPHWLGSNGDYWGWGQPERQGLYGMLQPFNQMSGLNDPNKDFVTIVNDIITNFEAPGLPCPLSDNWNLILYASRAQTSSPSARFDFHVLYNPAQPWCLLSPKRPLPGHIPSVFIRSICRDSPFEQIYPVYHIS